MYKIGQRVQVRLLDGREFKATISRVDYDTKYPYLVEPFDGSQNIWLLEKEIIGLV